MLRAIRKPCIEVAMAQTVEAVVRTHPGITARRDMWWVQPLVVFVLLGAFVVYATWAALQGNHYRFGPYLSPFYSPELFGNPHYAWFGGKPAWWPGWLPFSAAILILWAPAGFRVTCYYYRGAYYKAFWADPPSCTVREPRAHYHGESSFPLILQNVHRYFMYLALIFLVILGHDAWNGLWFTDPATGREVFGVGVGSLILIVNVVLLAGYTFGCHSLRHLIGGRLDRMSEHPLRLKCWSCANFFNSRHMGWAWPSLIFVAFTDLYIRLCSMGIWVDWRIF
jgi:hypothetical protein